VAAFRHIYDNGPVSRLAGNEIFQRLLPESFRPGVVSRLRDTGGHPQWVREVMAQDARREFEALGPANLHAAEISPTPEAGWQALPWAGYTTLDFPQFDLCRPPELLPGPFDLVICEQVLEHVVDPITAVDTLRRICRPDGHVFISTPFLVRLHDFPGDFWRFTPAGLELLLRRCGLEPLWVRAWGNRRAVVGNFDRWTSRLPGQSLRNESNLPVVVWSLARPSSR
jgi:SAM-dependent methyltransferase